MNIRKPYGFSLVELLTVVAIVVILASIAVSAYRQGVARSKTVVCMSNLRQIHAALQMYQTDHGAYPPDSLEWPAFKPYLGNA